MRKHLNIKVDGRVQGVFFRASTKTRADQLKIAGFVRNERDGSVYIEAEAEESVLNEFVEWCQRGPTTARVEKFELTEAPIKNFLTFEISR